MFLIGEAESAVHNGRIIMPTEYRLKKKHLLLMWKDAHTCFLGETKGALKFAAGTEGPVSGVEIDAENRLPIGDGKEGCRVRLRGCISTLEVRLLGF